MPSAPSRFEVEHLHRLVTQASVEARRLDGTFEAARAAGGLGPALAHWSEAAEALEEALARARSALLRDGTPGDQLVRIRERLTFVRRKARQFSVDQDLDACVEAWNGVGLELAQLSGSERDALVRLLQQQKPAVDRATGLLSQARQHDGRLQEEQNIVELRRQRDRARGKYERLRQAYLAAQRDFDAAQRQKAAEPGAEEHVVLRLPPLPEPVAARPLHRIVDREQGRPGVAARLERTLSHLATAEHRTLPDPNALELRAYLARMDSILARLQGKAGEELAEGARAVGAILLRMSVLAARAGSAPHLAAFRKLIDERKGQLHRIAQAQLAAELPKPSAAGLHALAGKRPGGPLGAVSRPGGPLRTLCETAQRGHGLPIGQAAQHYLATRGGSRLWNAVATFQTLTREGHVPRFSFGSWLRKDVSDHVSHALDAVSRTAGGATQALSGLATGAREGISSLGNRAGGALRVVGHASGKAVKQTASGLGKAGNGARSTWGEINLGAHALARVGRGGLQAVQAGASWAQHKAGAGVDHWLGEKVHSGLEWARKTGVAGAVGTGLRKGLSFVKGAAESSPLGLAVRKGYGFVKSGGLTQMWGATNRGAATAWGGLKNAAGAASTFLKTPAGQLLVTGLSLTASFIPGGVVVKAAIGAGIGAMQAISEGKDWKAVLASAAGGALTGAIPFLKIGPLAKVGVGALQGGITALASGGSLKEALKGAGGGVLDAFEPGAFHALKRLKSFRAAGKLLKGKKMSGARGPVHALEKALGSPGGHRVIGALERASAKGVKGGIWVSGKAARAQQVLDKVVVAGEKVHGALEQVHELAPGLSQALGDNAAGHLVSRAGEWAGAGDERLQKALGYGHAASDALSKSRSYLDAGLGHAGVKDPAKAYEKMTARADLRAGKKGALERVAQLKLEDHRRKHPPGALEKIPGLRKDGEEEEAVHLEGGGPKKSTHAAGGPSDPPAAAAAPPETAEQKAARVHRAWERIGAIARQVQKFELEAGNAQRRVQELLRKGLANEAGIELMGLGARCDSIDRALREARQLAKGHEPYEKEIAFYEDWHKRTRAKLHGAIADAKGLGGQVAISGAGIQESTHPDIFENTRAIYAVRTKVQSFAGALQDPEAAGQVQKVLVEARQAKADLRALQAKYRKDAAAHAFLTGGGTQDKLIDEVLRKLEGPAQQEASKPAAAKPGLAQRVENGRIDSGLEKVESGLGTGIRIGSKVDSGLEKLAGLAEQVSGMLGEDSPLGHLAHQLGEGAGSGHERLHEALGVAQQGKGFVEKGREILHQGLLVAEGEHAKKAEEVLRSGWELIKGLLGGGKAADRAQQDGTEAVQNALQWVTAFGQEVTAAIEEIEALMQGGRAQEAERRVEAVTALADQARAEIAAAVEAAAHDPKLSAQAASAQRHYLELRGHFFAFVQGLHGLGKPAPEGKERSARPGIDQLIERILHGAGGRIHADRDGASAEIEFQDLQDVDPAAVDTWIGSGQGTMLFAVVFAPFLPGEGATAPQGFFAKLFGRLEGFAERIGGWARKGSTLLGKGMHYAEMGMHGLSRVEGASEKVKGYAGRAEGLLEAMGLHGLAGYAGKIGGAAGWVDEEAAELHGGLKTADAWMGEGKEVTDQVEQGADVAAGMFGEASHGRFGKLVSLFRASRNGEGVEGKLSPDRVALGSVFDEPRRLDVSTLSQMESYLGGDFSGVRIHTGPGAAEVTRRFNAEAVTVRDHVFFAPGRFSPATVEGQKLIAHELTHVLQKGRANLDVRTAEGEALHAEHGYGRSPSMETLNLRRPEPGFRIASDGEGMGAASGIHTAKRTRSRGHEVGGKDALPDGEEMIERISGRVYELLMEELEQAFESR